MPLLFSDLADEWDAALDSDDRYRALIEFGRRLPPMDPALKTSATKVPGCSADVWVYPLEDNGLLRFQADSNADITRGVVAAIVSLVDGQTPAAILSTPIEAQLEALGLKRHLSANRTQGVPNMIARVREAAQRLAA
ncbi:SufE family protein [Sandaracinobacter neustonicus]|uniref:SufE family protein n=1 Tax=Sandaracinobacter neustonicus TaxID=1715348 RepID=A0A501XTM4_9SPHN|nr:SufE family protein [Sandaracinobacter neustonicus]TPE63998.1 SufE family protein [Sandaracinobacter neustonicus]